jgi:methylated-DNA-[protein]-cysteine S-methyltransferase
VQGASGFPQPHLMTGILLNFSLGFTSSMLDGNARGHGMGQTANHYFIFETAAGFCGIAWSKVGITSFQLPTRSAEGTERILLRRVPGAKLGAPTPEVVKAVAAVHRYFEGEKTDFSDFKLDLGEQDPFFERIYAAARRVGWGHTTTYGALAKELGAGPEAARDVGQAMAKNPVPLIIPCHRVLAAGGKAGGFSAPGGAAAKIRMLELEGVHVEPPRPVQQSFGF